jgi:integrase
MANAEKRDGKLTGHWYGEVKVKASGARYRKRFETKREAEAYEAYVKATGTEPEGRGEKLLGPTLKDMATQMQAKRKSTRDPSGDRRLAWIIDRIGHMPMSAIGTVTLDRLVEDLEKRPAQMAGKDKITDSTINRYLSAVSAVFTYACCRVEDLRRPKFPWRKTKGSRTHWFSEAQEDTLVPFMVSQGWVAEALALRVLCATGMRWGEFEGLEPHQCQPEWVLLDETKTDTPRDIPIDEDLARELKAMVVSGTLPKYLTMRRHLAAGVKACGYSPKLGIHNTRHGTATRLIKQGESPAIVQKFLGHKDLKTTMKYTHVEADDLMKASKKLSPRRGNSAPNDANPQILPFMKSTG